MSEDRWEYATGRSCDFGGGRGRGECVMEFSERRRGSTSGTCRFSTSASLRMRRRSATRCEMRFSCAGVKSCDPPSTKRQDCRTSSCRVVGESSSGGGSSYPPGAVPNERSLQSVRVLRSWEMGGWSGMVKSVGRAEESLSRDPLRGNRLLARLPFVHAPSSPSSALSNRSLPLSLRPS